MAKQTNCASLINSTREYNIICCVYFVVCVLWSWSPCILTFPHWDPSYHDACHHRTVNSRKSSIVLWNCGQYMLDCIVQTISGKAESVTVMWCWQCWLLPTSNRSRLQNGNVLTGLLLQWMEDVSEGHCKQIYSTGKKGVQRCLKEFWNFIQLPDTNMEVKRLWIKSKFRNHK